jgi:hypothetical protein
MCGEVSTIIIYLADRLIGNFLENIDMLLLSITSGELTDFDEGGISGH